MKTRLAAVALLASVSSPAWAQEAAPPSDITVSGSVALVSDYRFRGVSQSDKGFAVQGGITATHSSGAYAGFWSSNLAGWGTFGGPNLELDLIGGYKFPVAKGATLDVGLTWYVYPGGANKTDFAEPYVKLSGTVGPANLTAGVAYAPKQQALGKWYNTGASAQTGTPRQPRRQDRQPLYLGRRVRRRPQHPGYGQRPLRVFQGQFRPRPQRHERGADR